MPLNNTALAHRGTWAKRSGSGYYLRTYSITSAKGAYLSRSVSGMKRLALVATRCPGCGVVKVYLGRTLLKQVSLAARTTAKRRVIGVKTFLTGRRGTVKVVVASTGKPVRIEGLAVATG